MAVSVNTVIYRIGSRRKENLVALIGHAFLGWMVTDGYMAYRDHPRRQRCLAHLIRKALALAEGYYGPGSAFGRNLVRDLHRLIERVRDGDNDAAVTRLLARIKWNCQCNEYEIEQKVRAPAREILNDWEAVIAFVVRPRRFSAAGCRGRHGTRRYRARAGGFPAGAQLSGLAPAPGNLRPD